MEVNKDEGFGYSVFTKFVPDALKIHLTFSNVAIV